MTDLNLCRLSFISIACAFQRSLHHSVYFVLGGRLNMHELSGILGLDGPLQQLLGERRKSLGVSLNTEIEIGDSPGSGFILSGLQPDVKMLHVIFYYIRCRSEACAGHRI